ncbi:membrane protein [Salmonella enterica subsp. enterica serovar Choleraesuis]|nr:membrane protein [Salmonella enterica subsp. enterica serovar Choleraesuis]
MLITVFWGGTFLAVQYAMARSGPLFFVGLRFAAAATVLGVFSIRQMRGVTRQEIRAGMIIGTAIAFGYTLQTWGLRTIPSSQSAFITAMYVPLVPLLQWLLIRRMPGFMSWVGIALAFCGLMFLAGPQQSGLKLNAGEMLTLAGAVAIAAEIIMISMFAGKVDIRRVTVIQLAWASLLAFACMGPVGESVPPMSWGLWGVALGLGIFTALIQLTMNWAQRSVSPTRATVIYTGEPVWAGIFGRMAGERLQEHALLGAGLIILGVLASELKLRRRQPLPEDKVNPA